MELSLKRNPTTRIGAPLPITGIIACFWPKSSYYLKKKKFIGIGFGDMDSYKHIHSINDTIDKVDSNLLAGLCKDITMSLKDLDSNT